MPVDPDQLIALANELKDAKLRVITLENTIRDTVKEQKQQEHIPLSQLLPTASTPERIENLFVSNPTHNFTFKEVFEDIGGTESYLRSLLSRLMNEKRIESRGWGKYGMSLKGPKEEPIFESFPPPPSIDF